MKKRRFPFLRPVIPRVPKRVFGMVKQMSFFEISNGRRAPFGRTELLVPPPEPQERVLARGRVPGGWGVGKNCTSVAFFGNLFLTIFKNSKK